MPYHYAGENLSVEADNSGQRRNFNVPSDLRQFIVFDFTFVFVY